MPTKQSDQFDIERLQESLNGLTEGLERAFDSTARSLQDVFGSAPWFPEAARPSLRTPSPPRGKAPSCPPGYLEAARQWVSEHRAATAAMVAFLGTGAFIIWHHRKAGRAKRRAKRAKNGARTEVVIVAGSPYSPLTKSISLALERFGFIVYVPCATLSEEQTVQAESRGDVKALTFDVTSADSTRGAISKLSHLLEAQHRPNTSSTPYKLHLAAFILVDSADYPVGGLADITSLEWSNVVNSHLLATFTTIHAFLPLLSSQESSLLFLNPSITPSLASPSHAPESVVYGAVERYASTLRREYSSSLNVIQFNLGRFDLGRFSERRKQLVHTASPAEHGQFDHDDDSPRGAPLRALHNDIFDAIVRGKASRGTIFVGKGSRSYSLIGNWMPPGLINWLVSLRRNSPSRFATDLEDTLTVNSDWEASMSP